jgi:serine/threonine protein kinase
MELISGQTLRELIHRGERIPLDRALEIGEGILAALEYSHERGIVHRDIKPANIMLAATPSGGFQAKLLDFGLAKVMSEPSQQTMDHSGAITGSIHTISPEQLSRLPMDHRSDLYSLGCVFYKALTLQFPFHGDDVPSLIAAHLQHDFTPLSEARPDLPSALTAWVEKLFAFNKDDRPQSASEALQSLEPSTKTPAPNKRPDLRGKPALANPLTSPTPPPPKKNKPNPPVEVDESPTSRATPSHRSQNFVIAMAAVIAVCATLAILALTGNFGGGTSRPSPFAKKVKPTPTPAEKTSFKSSDRGEIKDKVGKQITVTGVIERLEHGEKSRYLIFAESDPRSGVMVSYDPAKTEISEWILKRKFVGQKVRVSGTIKLDGSRLLLEISSMDDLTLHADESPASK